VPSVISGSRKEYVTWYAFKKDLEEHLWGHVANDTWLEIKPKRPLPWDETDMQIALFKILEGPQDDG
jgi:hypothetical protein